MSGRDTDSAPLPVFLGLLALVVLAPLPFGAVQPWAVMTIQLSALVLLAAALVSRSEPGLWRSPLRLAMPAIVLLGVAVLQCIPLPRSLVGSLATLPGEANGAAGEFIQGMSAAWLPMSLEPPATVDAMLRLAAYLAIALVTMVVVRTESRLRLTLTVLTGAAVFQSLYGIVEYLSGSQNIFGYQKTFGLHAASGTFINHNHFSAYLVLALPLSLALALDRGPRRGPISGWRESLVALARPDGIRRIAAIAAAGIIFAALVLTYSRTGLALALLGSVTMLVLGSRSRRGAWRVGLLLLIPVVWLMWQDVQAPGVRMLNLGREVQSEGGRFAAWSHASGLIPGHLVLGTGLGTFESAFDTVRPSAIKLRWDHAHNEWLQVLLEMGVVPLLLLSLAIWRFWLGKARWSGHSTLGMAVAVSLVLAGLNALVEFSLRIPAIALLVAFMVGLWGGPLRRQKKRIDAARIDHGLAEPIVRIAR